MECNLKLTNPIGILLFSLAVSACSSSTLEEQADIGDVDGDGIPNTPGDAISWTVQKSDTNVDGVYDSVEVKQYSNNVLGYQMSDSNADGYAEYLYESSADATETTPNTTEKYALSSGYFSEETNTIENGLLSKSQLKQPSFLQDTTYSYDSDNNLLTIKVEQYGEDDGYEEPVYLYTESYVYNSDNQIVRTNTDDDGDDLIDTYAIHEYDANGNTIKTTVHYSTLDDENYDGLKTITYEYDANNRTTKIEYDNDGDGIVDNVTEYTNTVDADTGNLTIYTNIDTSLYFNVSVYNALARKIRNWIEEKANPGVPLYVYANTYDEDINPVFKDLPTVYSYDSNGDGLIEDDKNEYRNVKSINDNGLITQEKSYTSGTTDSSEGIPPSSLTNYYYFDIKPTCEEIYSGTNTTPADENCLISFENKEIWWSLSP
ncbi:hypothetical protein [Thiomicrorhabdus heinhorstiae]|uniref:YD repeat-containing protein n=1 Tax=Thiomicrorhabdus heinhorstiae TaxID=2748010 RepID=A0ABS0C1V0_9GAMM|nr:hypothetical protein [Thiomicrorhabdus heinhorstiae]MBF6058292.1 hypothetical protein [Thiomicrorhabdus heinhorstiae]